MIRTLLAFVLLTPILLVRAIEPSRLVAKALASPDSASFYFNQSRSEIKSLADEGDWLFCKNVYFTENFNFDSAVYFGNKALAVFEHAPNPELQYYLYNNLGKAYQKNGEYAKAIELLRQGLKQADDEHNQHWSAIFLVNISLNYHDFADYQKGVEYGRKAVNLLSDDSTRLLMTKILGLNAIAINFDDASQPDSALKYHFQILSYRTRIDSTKLGFAYNNIANTLLKQKNYREALSWLKRAIAISRLNDNGESADYYELAGNYTNLALLFSENGETANSLATLAEAEQYVIRSGSVEKRRDFYQASYQVYRRAGKSDEAFVAIEKYSNLKDSLFADTKAKQIAEMETRYQLAERENRLLQLDASSRRKTTLLVFVALLLLTVVTVALLVVRQMRFRRKQQDEEFKLKAAIAEIESQNKLQEQRLSISRDLHDNIGAQLTFIISSVENLRLAYPVSDVRIVNRLNRISDFARTTILELRDTIWAMNADAFCFDDLRSRLLNFIEKARHAGEAFQFTFEIDESLSAYKLSSPEGIALYRVIQEAINNAIKHSKAQLIGVTLENDAGGLKLTVCDDGQGFDQEQAAKGNGLANMQKRVEQFGGTFSISSSPDNGTCISIQFKSGNAHD